MSSREGGLSKVQFSLGLLQLPCYRSLFWLVELSCFFLSSKFGETEKPQPRRFTRRRVFLLIAGGHHP